MAALIRFLKDCDPFRAGDMAFLPGIRAAQLVVEGIAVDARASSSPVASAQVEEEE